ncbi:MAG: T9SS type A sorting domain-containing protein [Candidatus Cloacimonetes bacterium]|nr:T9SS type A sorting domain-containing protein [Candidatus Cloacimonadota bacterium]
MKRLMLIFPVLFVLIFSSNMLMAQNITGEINLPEFTDNSSITVYLRQVSNPVVATTETDVNGVYLFTNIPQGQYKLNFVPSDIEKAYYPVTTDPFTHNTTTNTIIPLITMTYINHNMVIVSQNLEVDGFRLISDAIDYTYGYINSNIYVNQEDVNIYIGEGDYYFCDYYLVNLRCYIPCRIPKVNLIGVTDNVTISPLHDNVPGSNGEILRYYLWQLDLTVNNITFKNFTSAANVEFLVGANISFYDCNFEDNGLYWDISEYENFTSGCAIRIVPCDPYCFVGGFLTINIENCTFTNNQASRGYNETVTLSQYPVGNGLGGAICVDMREEYIDSTIEINIKDNVFTNNAANYGGAVFLNGVENVNLINNEFTENTFSAVSFTNPESYPKKGAAIVALGSKLNLEKNLFNHQEQYYVNNSGYGEYVNWFNDCEDIISRNNTYINNYRFDLLYIIDSNSADLTNDLYRKGNTAVDFSVKIENTSYEVDYCLSYGSSGDDFVDGTGDDLITSNCISTDPQLDATTFQPIWNYEILSPCIDTGNPDTNDNFLPWYIDIDEWDEDGSRLDIGAISAEEHKNSFFMLSPEREYNWISIPAVDCFENSTRDNDIVSYVFDEYMDNGLFEDYHDDYILEHLEWMYNDEWGLISWYNDDFELSPENVMDLEVRSQKGYKIKMNEDLVTSHIFKYGGFLPGTAGNPDDMLHIEEPESGRNCYYNDIINGWEREIWLGYFLEASLDPMEALEPVWDDIIKVQARDWAIVRLPIAGPGNGYTDNWLSCGEPAINYGEMVEVYYIGDDDVDFHWGGDDPYPPYVPYYSRELAEYFEYEEQEDYIPIFVEIDLDCYEEGEKPIEIAIFVDDECKGAAVIKDDQVQLNAYILNDPTIELKDLEFELWFPQRGGVIQVDNYAYRNNDTGHFVSQKAVVADCGHFLQVSFRDEDLENGSLPEVTSLKGNSPNPFNPETKIEFELANDSSVKLDVYNIKGQHVRSLINESLPAARHDVIWNGKNNLGQEVSSGVYFYVLQADGLTLSHKMLLLK